MQPGDISVVFPLQSCSSSGLQSLPLYHEKFQRDIYRDFSSRWRGPWNLWTPQHRGPLLDISSGSGTGPLRYYKKNFRIIFSRFVSSLEGDSKLKYKNKDFFPSNIR
jgi:hypothetical protein